VRRAHGGSGEHRRRTGWRAAPGRRRRRPRRRPQPARGASRAWTRQPSRTCQPRFKHEGESGGMALLWQGRCSSKGAVAHRSAPTPYVTRAPVGEKARPSTRCRPARAEATSSPRRQSHSATSGVGERSHDASSSPSAACHADRTPASASMQPQPTCSLSQHAASASTQPQPACSLSQHAASASMQPQPACSLSQHAASASTQLPLQH
jgi:hypothetical protein